jgi:dihydroflavonol-4-reductase
MTVLVVGGNGFIGSAVVRQLVGGGRRVRCLLRPHSRTERIDDLDVERLTGDVRDADSLRRAVEGCDGVVHLGGPSSWTDIDSPLMPEVVVSGTRNVLDAAARAGAPRVVYVSSATAVNGTETPVVHDEESPSTLALERFAYAKAKREAEALCRRAAEGGLAVSIVNPTEVYGPRDTALITSGTLVDFARSAPALVCDGGTSVAHVEDVARGIIAALDRGRPGERYILGGENLSVRELARTTLELLGRPVKTISVPNRLLRAIARVGGALRLPLPFNPAVIPYATLYWFMSSAKAQRELGTHFRSAKETLADTLRGLREAGRIA